MDATETLASRRTALKYGLGTAATLVLVGSGLLASAERAAADVVNAQLFALNGERVMIDGLVVPVLGFGSAPDRVEIPGGRLEVETGDTVNLTLTNGTGRQIGLTVPGIPGVPGTPVPPGASRTISFTAPDRPGTFVYIGTIDGSADTGRALGAAGALVVRARGAAGSIEANFPGALARARRQPLFGTQAAAIPTEIVQERTWLFAELNPATARDLAGGRVALPSDPEPEYFLINGVSGMLAVEDPATFLEGRAGGLGRPGDATLVRMIDTGRAPRSVHFHGNHFWVLSHPDAPWLVGAFKDTVRIPPGTVVDVLFPMETPPDSMPVVERAQKYVVHDHIEMAETASGGHYAGGMVSESVFD
ncbi:multicopper oxidase domain-containing protein [Geodermatophilus ruber]|uniref:Multicopper oxidase n=1 Tax=Geodermatophilus ruber TaxID=504800 RepID=A0A1I4DWY4_9ACTN|nr:multicopper oxidase domain-containing protein [Geodermatophilus ruber]SFK97945.1 Multicopper oxidase [Geodermatophilus ruber]